MEKRPLARNVPPKALTREIPLAYCDIQALSHLPVHKHKALALEGTLIERSSLERQNQRSFISSQFQLRHLEKFSSGYT